jgi:hypothetical protein
VPKGYPEKPLTLDEVVEKARDCCAGILDPAQFDALVHTVTHLEEVPDVSVLARSLASTKVDASVIA